MNPPTPLIMNPSLPAPTKPTTPPLGVDEARHLLDLALQKEAELTAAAHPDVSLQRALNNHTGSSILVPPATP